VPGIPEGEQHGGHPVFNVIFLVVVQSPQKKFAQPAVVPGKKKFLNLTSACLR